MLQPFPHVRLSTCLILSCLLMACSQPDAPKTTESKPAMIELIRADVSSVALGEATGKTAFTGTIRAIDQSSIQAQVSATATQVNAQIGDRVSQGQLLVILNNQDNAARLAQAQANLTSTQAQANLAKSLVNRKKNLYDQGFISKLEYEQSQVDYQGQLANVQAQQANVDIARKANQDGQIFSPISGVITKRQVEPGQTVSLGQTLFEIVNPEQLELQAYLPVEQQNALQVGQNIEYRLQGQPEVLSATVTRISPLADAVNRQIEFFAQPAQHVRSLSIGSFIQGDLIASQGVTGQLIALSSIQSIDRQPYVWVIRQDKIAKVPVKILQQRYAEDLAVVEGLQPNDQISRVPFSEQDIGRRVVIG